MIGDATDRGADPGESVDPSTDVDPEVDEAPDEPDFGDSGLVPAVVQDVRTGRVRMLAYMNRDALDRTRETGRVTFWSRSRGELWEKGETSGNWLEARSIELDCDGDALLVRAVPHGPTCHTGRESCFDTRTLWRADGGTGGGRGDGGETSVREERAGDADGVASPGGGDDGGLATRSASAGGERLSSILAELLEVVGERDRVRPEGSYTVRLLEGGPEAAGRKVAEEALEVALTSVSEPERADEESADLLYHLLVLWRTLDLDADDVARVLRGRRPSSNE